WKITPVPAGQAPVFNDHFDYPLAPTHVLQLDIKEAPYSFRVMLVQLAKDGERWAEVVPCAKAKTVIAIRAAQAAKAKRAERVENRAVDGAVQLQEAAGLDVVTDGELRRYAFFGHLIDAVDGFDKFGGWAIPFHDEQGGELVFKRPVVVDRLRWRRSMCGEELT